MKQGWWDAMRVIDVEAAAALLNVTPDFVRQLVAERRVPFFRIGKFTRFDSAELEKWRKQGRVELRDDHRF